MHSVPCSFPFLSQETSFPSCCSQVQTVSLVIHLPSSFSFWSTGFLMPTALFLLPLMAMLSFLKLNLFWNAERGCRERESFHCLIHSIKGPQRLGPGHGEWRSQEPLLSQADEQVVGWEVEHLGHAPIFTRDAGTQATTYLLCQNTSRMAVFRPSFLITTPSAPALHRLP